MRYPLGTVTSLTNGNLTVNSEGSYFLILETGNKIIINNEEREVDTVFSDYQFTVYTPFSGYTVGEYIYTEDKCVYLKYQLWKVDSALANYDLQLINISTMQSGEERIEYSETMSSISQLQKLRDRLQGQLDECIAEANGGSIWLTRRYEYNTL